jgi:hypothetical protein
MDGSEAFGAPGWRSVLGALGAKPALDGYTAATAQALGAAFKTTYGTSSPVYQTLADATLAAPSVIILFSDGDIQDDPTRLDSLHAVAATGAPVLAVATSASVIDILPGTRFATYGAASDADAFQSTLRASLRLAVAEQAFSTTSTSSLLTSNDVASIVPNPGPGTSEGDNSDSDLVSTRGCGWTGQNPGGYLKMVLLLWMNPSAADASKTQLRQDAKDAKAQPVTGLDADEAWTYLSGATTVPTANDRRLLAMRGNLIVALEAVAEPAPDVPPVSALASKVLAGIK